MLYSNLKKKVLNQYNNNILKKFNLDILENKYL